MDEIDRIVVGVAMPESQPWDAANVDPATRIAVRQAFRLAASIGIPLEMVSVLDPPEAGFFASTTEASLRADNDRDEARRVLADLSAHHANLTTNTKQTVVHGTDWFEILRAAGGSRQTLIICGTRTSGAVRRLLFGTTGQKLLRNAPGPVWLVKPQTDDDAVLDVLAATDLSEVGTQVISAGVTLGRAIPIQLTVMHAVDTNHHRRMTRAGTSEDELAKRSEEAKAEAEAQLHDQLSETDFRTLDSGVRTQMAEGVPDRCVLTAIEELDIDLLIMASSGRGGIPGMPFGNTAERLLPELPCSLLTVKPNDFVCPIDLS
jgi:universal stress protein E